MGGFDVPPSGNHERSPPVTQRPFLSAFLLSCFALPAFAQVAAPPTPALSPAAAAIVAASREDNRVMAHADYLTNHIGPRLTGTPANVLACEWAADQLRAFGLQNVHLEAWGEVPVTFERGPWFGAMLWKDGDAARREMLEFNTPAWSAGTKGLRRGKAVLLPADEAAFTALKDRLPGAWLVVPGTPAASNTFDALKACEAAGILGVVRGSSDQYLRTGGARGVDWRKLDMSNLPKLAQITIVADQWKRLNEQLAAGKEIELEFSVQNRFRPGPVKIYNVVGDIPGTDRKDEFVLLGGHIDSWDGSTGAVDNASGVATAMEAVRLIQKSGQKPRRTIRIVLWSGEEQGLLGSAAYVAQHKDEMPRVSVYLNHDSGTNYVSGLPATKAMAEDLRQVFAGVETIDDGMKFGVQEVEGLRGGGSDHTSFLAANVPAWSWSLSGDHNYMHIWHTQNDLYDELVEKNQRHSATVIAIGALGIANLDGLLSRDKLLAPGGAGGPPGGYNLGIAIDGKKVTEVQKDGAFGKAGFQVGDVIVKVGETEITGVRELFGAARALTAPAKVTVLRDGKQVVLELTLPPRRQ
jgi:hypothetical protein